jgi:hypothetical protein
MPSTFTQNTGIELIADGEQSGLWGQTTNNNFDIVDRAVNGVGFITLSSTSLTLTTSSGVLSDGQFSALVFSGSPGGTATVTIAPDTAQKTYLVRNQTDQTVTFTQGSGGNVSLPSGRSAVIACTGAGASSAVFDITALMNTATSANTAGAIVQRDGSGNFVAGTVTAALTGNASTASALQTARTIGGVSFDGTSNINLPGVNQAGNQNTAGNAAGLTGLTASIVELNLMDDVESSLSATGWSRLPGGLIIQWGRFSSSSGGTGTISFPLSFPTACASIVASQNHTGTSQTNVDNQLQFFNIGVSSFGYFANDVGGAVGTITYGWLAVGY